VPELIINRADDSGEYDSTIVRFGEESHYYTYTISPRGYRTSINPVIECIKQYLLQELKITRKAQYNRSYRRNRGYYAPTKKDFSHLINIGEEGYPILFNKVKTRYYVNGVMGNKDVLVAAIARTIYKSCFVDDAMELDAFLVRHIKLPELVSYALENNAPYHFFIEDNSYYGRKKISCRLKVNVIGDDKVAMEISDGIWGELTIKQMNTFMNAYYKNKKNNSWADLNPNQFWEKVMKRPPTESEEQLMMAFLNQNRTEKVARNRARDLMIHISQRYSDRIKINWGSPDKLLDVSDKPTIMYVHGKLADWKLTDRGLKSQGQQNVSTFVWIHEEDNEKGIWRGPICIDNLDNKSPTGDQFVTRALGLLNDELLLKRVSTIKSYLNKEHVVGQTTQRIKLFQQ
jgi:hypothetical protein